MNEFPDMSEPEEPHFEDQERLPEQLEGGDGDALVDPTAGIVRFPEGELEAPQDTGDYFNDVPAPQEADGPLPSDPFGDSPFTDSRSVQAAETFNEAADTINNSVHDARKTLAASRQQIEAIRTQNPQLADQLDALLATVDQTQRHVEAITVRPLSPERISESVLREQGLTLDTGRPAVGFGIECFKGYWPSFEEAGLCREQLNRGVQSALLTHAPHVREERYTVGDRQYTRQVLDLICDTSEGSVTFEVTPDGLTAAFNPKGQSETRYSRYHLANDMPLSSDLPNSFVHRDTMPGSERYKGLPEYGTIPTAKIWEYRHEHSAALQERLLAQRQVGINDEPVCFAEVEHINRLLERAVPYGRLMNILLIADRRMKARHLPSAEEAKEAAALFRNGMQAYLAAKGFTDVYSEGAKTTIDLSTLRGKQVMSGTLQTGRECLVHADGTSVEPYIRVHAGRNLTPKEAVRTLKGLRRILPAGWAMPDNAQFYLDGEAKYGIDGETGELRGGRSSRYIDQAGNTYAFPSTSRRTEWRADMAEVHAILPFLKNPYW